MIDNIKKKKIGRSVFVITNGEENKIIKYEPSCGASLFNKISRKCFGGSLPFYNEMQVNDFLGRHDFSFFRRPESKVDYKNKLISFEFLDALESRDLDKNDLNSAIDSLIELAQVASDFKVKGVRGFVLGLIESPAINTLKSIVFSGATVFEKNNGLMILLWSFLKDKKSKGVFLHNDLFNKNLLKAQDGKIYFIDFEDAIVEKRYPITDAVNILFDENSLTLDKKLIRHFWNTAIIDLTEIHTSESALVDQVRVCLLRRAFSQNKKNREINVNNEKLLRIVLKKKDFNSWWDAQK
jgi:hypothetical protein